MIEDWNEVRVALAGSASAPSNIAEWALTRHLKRGAGDRIALRWRPRSGPTRVFTYADVDRAASRFAAGLRATGVGDGEAVVFRLDPVPELVAGILGTLRAGAVVSVVAPGTGWDSAARRCRDTSARVLVTSPEPPPVPAAGLAEHVFTVGAPGNLDVPVPVEAASSGSEDLGVWLSDHSETHPDAHVDDETPAFLLPSSPPPEGAPLAVLGHGAAVALAATGRSVLGLGGGVRAWTAAEPGGGLLEGYGILAPLILGATAFLDEAGPVPERMLDNLGSTEIHVLLAPRSVLESLSASVAGATGATSPPVRYLRAVLSAGRPLPESAAARLAGHFRREIRAVWAEPETGAIVLACPAGAPASADGSWGRAADGFDVAPVAIESDGLRLTGPGEVGTLAVRAPWPSMFQSFLGDPDRYRTRFRDGWYVSGRRAVRDPAGWIRPTEGPELG